MLSLSLVKRPSLSLVGILLAMSSSIGVGVSASNTTGIPEGAWDSHIHVVDPTRYPLDPNATYTPGVFTAWDNVLFEQSIGASHNTIVQPSIYGNDNTYLLLALEAYGPDRARGVVVFDPNVTTAAELQHWDSLGVRGVRVNLGFTDELPSAEEFKITLQQYADAIRPFDWAMEAYIPMSMITELEDFLPTLGVMVVFDHFGHPDIPETAGDTALDPYTIEGFQSLINLLKGGTTWVKVSGPYRLSKTGAPYYTDMDPLVKEFVKAADGRLVYASDWPHINFDEAVDIKPWTLHLLDLVAGHKGAAERLFRDNARALWGADTQS